jgi:IS30 family transposase
MSITQIALRLGVHKSTISRELKRNAQVDDVESQIFWLGVYNLWSRQEVLDYLDKLKKNGNPTLQPEKCWTATMAQSIRNRRLYLANQLRRRKNPETAKWVIEKLKEHWSPEQIAGRSKIDGPEPVSHEFVYQMIISDRKRKGTLFRGLKRFRKRKQRIAMRTYGSTIPNRTSIESRPIEATQRSELGHIEGDLIVGYCNDGYILTSVDRKSRFTVLRKIPNKKKITVRLQQEVAFRKFRSVSSCTVDNGTEFTDHQTLTKNTGVPVFFCHPYCSTERGTVENTNGLIRYFLPKKSRFASLTQTHLNRIEYLMNNRPRKCLGYLTPKEVQFNQNICLPKHHSPPHTVAFDS